MAGAANTVVLDDGRRVGDNTDIPGIVAALRRARRRPGRLARWSSVGARPRRRRRWRCATWVPGRSTLAVQRRRAGRRDPRRRSRGTRGPSRSTSCRSTGSGDLRGAGRRVGPRGVDHPRRGADPGAGAGWSTRADVVFEVLYEPVAHPAGPGGDRRRPRARRRARPAGAPGGAPGRADDRAARTPRGDAGRGPGGARRPVRRHVIGVDRCQRVTPIVPDLLRRPVRFLPRSPRRPSYPVRLA